MSAIALIYQIMRRRVGEATAAIRRTTRTEKTQSGKWLATRLWTGVGRVWRLDSDKPRLVASAFGDPPLPKNGNPQMLECEYFVDEDRVIKLESNQRGTPATSFVSVNELDLATG